jgi:hypothetical protein
MAVVRFLAFYVCCIAIIVGSIFAAPHFTDLAHYLLGGS